ncbi:LacI family DNA-binding transcriptional regulator [Echinicola sediminis]
MKNITIKDIAKELGLAISTVSRAFNNKGDIKEETKTMILEKAEAMGYRPNPVAKRLISRKTFTIGAVIPEFMNSFFPEVLMGIQDILSSNGYQLVITQSNENPTMEKDNLNYLYSNMVDGLIVSITDNSNFAHYKNLSEKGLPIVFFNRVFDIPNTSCVKFDDFKWSFFATEHLILQGYKKIYHLSGRKEHQKLELFTERIKGFKKALEKHNLHFSEDHVISTGLFHYESEQVVQQLIEDKNLPDAFFCVNDSTAIGAMKTLKKNGYKIPEDIGIMGFTETPIVEMVDPSLSSVKQPTYDMGVQVANLLIAQLKDEKNFRPQTIVLQGKLNIRESSQLKNQGN